MPASLVTLVRGIDLLLAERSRAPPVVVKGVMYTLNNSENAIHFPSGLGEKIFAYCDVKCVRAVPPFRSTLLNAFLPASLL